jgi:hypothetical protein
MNKSLILLALLTSLSLAFGQGQVAFQNSVTTLVSTNSFSPPSATMSGPAGTYQFALFWAPAGSTAPGSFQFSGAYGTNVDVAGRFSGGAGNQSPALQGQAIGTQVSVLFRGWSADAGLGTPVNGDPTVWNKVADTVLYAQTKGGAGTDWVLDSNWLYGESGIGSVTLGGGAQPIPTPFGSLPGLINNGFVLHLPPVPEPATFSLLGLGTLALALRCRRKPSLESSGRFCPANGPAESSL